MVFYVVACLPVLYVTAIVGKAYCILYRAHYPKCLCYWQCHGKIRGQNATVLQRSNTCGEVEGAMAVVDHCHSLGSNKGALTYIVCFSSWRPGT